MIQPPLSTRTDCVGAQGKEIQMRVEKVKSGLSGVQLQPYRINNTINVSLLCLPSPYSVATTKILQAPLIIPHVANILG